MDHWLKNIIIFNAIICQIINYPLSNHSTECSSVIISFYFQATFAGPRDSFLEFTTEANIIPNGVYPVPDCHGEDCYSTLV